MRWMRRDGVINAGARRVQRVYLVLLLLHTLAASFIWGINTLFLLDAGLTNTQAFAANAFFTAGLVLFEVPTGVVADLRGRRLSYLLGTLTLALSTLLYLLMWRISAPFWAWALASALLGLGFTFLSGAVQSWLVDALTAHSYLRDLAHCGCPADEHAVLLFRSDSRSQA
jgi:MFS family permease